MTDNTQQYLKLVKQGYVIGVDELHGCNMHEDCDHADYLAKQKGKRLAAHCWSEDCEDCFGC